MVPVRATVWVISYTARIKLYFCNYLLVWSTSCQSAVLFATGSCGMACDAENMLGPPHMGDWAVVDAFAVAAPQRDAASHTCSLHDCMGAGHARSFVGFALFRIVGTLRGALPCAVVPVSFLGCAAHMPWVFATRAGSGLAAGQPHSHPLVPLRHKADPSRPRPLCLVLLHLLGLILGVLGDFLACCVVSSDMHAKKHCYARPSVLFVQGCSWFALHFWGFAWQ